ncbi:MAG: hypothetical protein AB1758_26510 [Candidatus Eremiobacterota bacterium]
MRTEFGQESRPERERALARCHADCGNDYSATRRVLSEGDLGQAMAAHRLLNGTLVELKAQGVGWWELECLKVLKEQRQPGQTLLQGVQALVPRLHIGALLGQDSAKQIIEAALRQPQGGRTGVEEREGGIIVGGVRVNVKREVPER